MEPLSPFEDVAGTEVSEDEREQLNWNSVEHWPYFPTCFGSSLGLFSHGRLLLSVCVHQSGIGMLSTPT
jgi:hypothetical protein